MKAIYFLDKDWQVGKLRKGGWAIFYKDSRCKDYLNQTGLGSRFPTAVAALKALHNCKFDPYSEKQ
jgi:hypothetical protein